MLAYVVQVKGKKLQIFEHTKDLLNELESSAEVDARQKALTGLRELGLEDFGHVLWSMPAAEFPKLSRLLPAMGRGGSYDGRCSTFDVRRSCSAFAGPWGLDVASCHRLRRNRRCVEP